MSDYRNMHPAITRVQHRDRTNTDVLDTNIPSLQKRCRYILAKQETDVDGMSFYSFTDGSALSEATFLLSPKEYFQKLLSMRDEIDRYVSFLPHVETEWDGMGVLLRATAVNENECFAAIEELLAAMAVMDGLVGFTDEHLL